MLLRFLTIILLFLMTSGYANAQSYTEGVITRDFVSEQEMKRDLLQMLADFSRYMVDDFQECKAPNSIGEACGAFKGEHTMANDERGVRPNADLSMICAFLVKYAKPQNVKLPDGISYDKLEDMAMKSLVFAYSTHKANRLKVCSTNNYWGSVSEQDHVWESSLWAMSVAYSALFQWDKLNDAQREYIHSMLKAECNYELERTIPTGYQGDTKAEENGWEVDVLASALALFPNDELAPKWFERMREFAINSYSHESDANDRTIVDSWYDSKTVSDLYKGQNLYSDYSLQNHNLFHTSYQNVVMQELGEADLILRLLHSKGSAALMHNNQEVQDSILNWLALADGELAMPNGNDWSLFLYDQITSYSTQACFQRDPNALMLENLAYKYIKARQKTTTDGSWLLRADVGARRMGVEAHRVMMTYLMHEICPTSDLKPTLWSDFRDKYSKAKLIPCQNIVRAYSPKMFSCFSWSKGLKSYTGYFTSDKTDKNKIIVPYRANNTGNIIGWYEVEDKKTNAEPVVDGIYHFGVPKVINGKESKTETDSCAYTMNGELSCNEGSLDNRFALFATPGGNLVYLDYVTANKDCTIKAAKGGMLAISTDELMSTSRTLYYNNGSATSNVTLDGSEFKTFPTNWLNIDNEVGVVYVPTAIKKAKNSNSKENGQNMMAFGDRSQNNSIFTSKLYPMYCGAKRTVKQGETVDIRCLIYSPDQTSAETKFAASKAKSLRNKLPEGWNGVLFNDGGTTYAFISNFSGVETAKIFGKKLNIKQNNSIVIGVK